MPWLIRYFRERNGRLPAREFLAQMANQKLAAKLMRFTLATAEYGFSLGGGIFEVCHSYPDLYEVRARQGNDLGRVYCTVDGPLLILLGGLVKPNGEATPAAILDQANACLLEYKSTRDAL